MGHQIVKQPNGKLAIYSDGVSGWLRSNMTVDDVAEYYAERAAKDARDSARKTAELVINDKARKAYYQFTETFAACNAHAKASGHEVLPGPVDEKLYAELMNPDDPWELETNG